MISSIEAVFIALGLLVLVAFTMARVQGRRHTAACCAPADPRRDLRMRAAFADERPAPAPPD